MNQSFLEIAGNYMEVLFAHISAGDPVWGNADDPIRFAISKLAHIHFAFAKEYADNLSNIGEENFRINQSGNPSLDNIKNTKVISLNNLSKYLNCQLEEQKYIVLIKHPLSSELGDASTQMNKTLLALNEFCNQFKFKVIGIYPNTDPGSFDILESIEKYKDNDNFKFYKNLPHDEFVNLMRNASALVGNSSMGILEAPYYKLPVVNIGHRQRGRLNAGNVEFVDYSSKNIIKSLKKACFSKDYRRKISKLNNPYGDGYASLRIADFLESIDLNDRKWYIKKELC